MFIHVQIKQMHTTIDLVATELIQSRLLDVKQAHE